MTQTGKRAPSGTIALIEYLLAACLLAWFAATTLPQAWRALNSDFANYYIVAHLLRDHSSTARIYEWIWFQRQKDHLGISQPLVAMQLITPFSTLFLRPFAYLSPLTAKHLWLLLNAALLLASAWMLVRIVILPRSRMVLLIAASYPLQRNLQNGQFYLLLLFFLTWGLWLYLRGYRFCAGAAIAVAIGLKLFPVLFVLYFLRKRDWRALTGVAAGGACVAATSLAAFGWQLHRVYFLQVLPRGMLGESTGPYNLTTASFPILFHRLFVFEPALNPHPAIHAAWLLPLLVAAAQLLLLVPLILLTRSHGDGDLQVPLEWSAVVLVCLTLSPLPASYHFVLLLLPAAVLLKTTSQHTSRAWLIAVVLLYLAIGFPLWPGKSGEGWLPLLHVPRLYAMLALSALSLLQLKQISGGYKSSPPHSSFWRSQKLCIGNSFWPWIGALAALSAVGAISGLNAQRNIATWYAGRLEVANSADVLSQPEWTPQGTSFIAMGRDRYRAYQTHEEEQLPHPLDELSQTSLGAERCVERAAPTSAIVCSGPEASEIPSAESPLLSPDGDWLAYVREDHGRARLWLHSLHAPQPDVPVTSSEFDVLEASFAPDRTIVFAAFKQGAPSALFRLSPKAAGKIERLTTLESRYPAISSDGRWLAYSQLVHGSWNLRLRNLNSGATESFTDAACNSVESAWENDSHTLLYASDCGRGYGQTALYRRRFIP
jgi:hypothetical protein